MDTKKSYIINISHRNANFFLLTLYILLPGTSGSVKFNKLHYETFTSEFESDWKPHSYGLVPD